VARRYHLYASVLVTVCVLLSGCSRRETPAKTQINNSVAAGISPAEDLTREHAVLERILLIYEEVNKHNELVDPQKKALSEASTLMKQFIEDYHEKLEEQYVFPQFIKAKKEVELVGTLLIQHDSGRKITKRIIEISGLKSVDKQTRDELSRLIIEFIRMYRPHAAREGSVLFREYPTVVGASEYRELAEEFEDREHELFGDSGFDGIVDQVAGIEKQLGIYELSKFTPKT